MASLAQTDLSAPCRRCAETLQEWERFCPFCGEDQQAATADAGGAVPRTERKAQVPAADETFAPLVLDFANTVQPDAEEITELPDPIDVGTAAHEGTAPTTAPQAADPFGVHGAQARRPPRSVTPRRMAAVAIGVVLALILGQLAYLTRERGYLDSKAGTGGLPAVKADLARLQTALRGADGGDEVRTPPRAAAPAKPVAAAAPAAPAATVAPVAAVAPAPAETPAPQAAANDCNETLAALALCATK